MRRVFVRKRPAAVLFGGQATTAIRMARFARPFTDHVAHGLRAFAAVNGGFMMPVDLSRGSRARRYGVVYLTRVQAAADTNDHEPE